VDIGIEFWHERSHGGRAGAPAKRLPVGGNPGTTCPGEDVQR
jgi:hypothetical protein